MTDKELLIAAALVPPMSLNEFWEKAIHLSEEEMRGVLVRSGNRILQYTPLDNENSSATWRRIL